jgi:hypothetical protein
VSVGRLPGAALGVLASAALVLAMPAPRHADAEDAPPASAQASAPAAESGAGLLNGWTTTSSGRVVGRGVAVHGDERKYREDYDDLGSGGGASGATSAYDAAGHYLQLDGAFLEQQKGTDLDQGELHVRGGQWGRWGITGDLTRSQAFYDDTYGGPLHAFPFTNGLGRDLVTTRTNGRLKFEWLFGDRGRATLDYRHGENDGNRSMIKGSLVQSLAPFAFRFPAFQSLHVHGDAVDFRTTLPLGPLLLLVTSGYTDEHDRTTTRETNWGPDALSDRSGYRDDVHVKMARAGVDLSTPPVWPVFAQAGYDFLYADTDSGSSYSQFAGTSGSELVRSDDGISVQDRGHLAHGGAIFTPVRDLLVRVAYSMVDRNRDGAGTELRSTGIATPPQTVRNTGAKDLFRQNPRLEITYAGLPRTLLRARYAYEHSERDLDYSMLGPAVAPLDPVERLERTNSDQDIHVADFEARVRPVTPLLLSTGYEYRHEHDTEDLIQVVDEAVLGDRTRHRDTVYASARVRAGGRTSFDVRGEYQHEHFDRTDAPGDSTTSVSAEMVTARAVSVVTPRFTLTSLFSLANRDQNVGGPPRLVLGTFRPMEFRGRSVTGAVAGSYTIDDRTDAQLQYSIVDAGGSLDNVGQRVLFTVGRRLSEHARIAVGYAYLTFDQGLYGGDDYAAHVGWTSLNLTF